ncbi:hypothetical protein [Parasitella parasitica]|uniref:Uncharacterized protein n=1 Tax=Parasitella parasitica TaxID=35722 RepID=A0A0B7NEL9_9FUNG|nr:hypothetical protein [Parasitella parasitica]
MRDSEAAHLATFISSCPPLLKCYDVDFVPVAPDILTAIDKSGIKLEATTAAPGNSQKQIKDLFASNQKYIIEAMKTLNRPLSSSLMATERQDIVNTLQGFPQTQVFDNQI